MRKQRCANCGNAARIASKSIFSETLLIDFVVKKYCDSQPLYRQYAKLRRDAELDLPLTTIKDDMLRMANCWSRLSMPCRARSFPQAMFRPVESRTGAAAVSIPAMPGPLPLTPLKAA